MRYRFTPCVSTGDPATAQGRSCHEGRYPPPVQRHLGDLRLRRELADKRLFPAVDVDASSTRKEEILLAPDELKVIWQLRRVLHALEPQQALELLMEQMRKTKSNAEFLLQVQKTTIGTDRDR